MATSQNEINTYICARPSSFRYRRRCKVWSQAHSYASVKSVAHGEIKQNCRRSGLRFSRPSTVLFYFTMCDGRALVNAHTLCRGPDARGAAVGPSLCLVSRQFNGPSTIRYRIHVDISISSHALKIRSFESALPSDDCKNILDGVGLR